VTLARLFFDKFDGIVPGLTLDNRVGSKFSFPHWKSLSLRPIHDWTGL